MSAKVRPRGRSPVALNAVVAAAVVGAVVGAVVAARAMPALRWAASHKPMGRAATAASKAKTRITPSTASVSRCAMRRRRSVRQILRPMSRRRLPRSPPTTAPRPPVRVTNRHRSRHLHRPLHLPAKHRDRSCPGPLLRRPAQARGPLRRNTTRTDRSSRLRRLLRQAPQQSSYRDFCSGPAHPQNHCRRRNSGRAPRAMAVPARSRETAQSARARGADTLECLCSR